jgi:PAS domain-containing protein
MRNIFALPDFLLLQLYRKARIYLLATYLLLSLTIAYLCSNRIEGLEYALILFVIVQGGVWISLKLKININIFTIPIGLIFLFFADLYSNKGAPVYIFMLMMYLYINVFIRYKFLRFYYLCFALLVTILMVYPDSSFEALLRIMVTYFVAAFTMFMLIDYLRKIERDLASRNQDLTDIFNSSPLPIMLIEYNGNISMMNDSCCELFGMQQDALQDKTLRDIFYFEKAKRADDLLKHFKRAIDENRTLRIEEE